MDNKFLQIINTLKIPTLTLIGIFFYTGYELLKNSNVISPATVSGATLLCVGVILSLIIFIDYRYKEQSEHVMSQQSKGIDNLSRALKNVTDTHSKMEKSTQDDITNSHDKIGGENRSQYSVGENRGTSIK